MEQLASLWSEFGRLAAVGTDKAGAPPALPAELPAVAAGLPPERLLLEGVARLAVPATAGRLPSTGSAAPLAACAADSRPPTGPQASYALARMLGGDEVDALPEWAGAVEAAGRRIADHLLPSALDHILTVKPAAERTRWMHLAGERGRWLAAMDPRWAPLLTAAAADDELPADLDEAWQTGDKEQRPALLTRLRRTDPARGRALVESTRAQERADDLTVFVGLCRDGLSMADHDWLEGLLDGKSKQVRRTAASLLARLPESALVARMLARAAASLRYTPPVTKFLRKRPAVLEVTLPADPDAAAARDGLEPGGAKQGVGDRAGLLQQIVAAIPPSRLAAALGAEPEPMIGAAAATEWAEALVGGFVRAAINTGDAEWARHLMDAVTIDAIPVDKVMDDDQRIALLRLTGAAWLDQFLVANLLNRDNKLGKLWALEHLALLDHVPSEALGRQALVLVRALDTSYDVAAARGSLRVLAYRLPRSLLADALSGPVSVETTTSSRFMTTIDFRRSYLEELQP